MRSRGTRFVRGSELAATAAAGIALAIMALATQQHAAPAPSQSLTDSGAEGWWSSPPSSAADPSLGHPQTGSTPYRSFPATPAPPSVGGSTPSPSPVRPVPSPPSEALPDDPPATASAAEVLQFPLRAAFYYPWFPETWGEPPAHSQHIPSLGFYDSADEDVIRTHLAAMSYAHIDVGIASWWGAGSRTDQRLQRILDVASEWDVRWTIYYEPEGTFDPGSAELAKDIEYIVTKYGGHPRFLRDAGQPVIFVYADGADACGMAERWEVAAPAVHVVLKVFPGYRGCASQPDGWHQYAPASAVHHQQGFSFSVSPGFHHYRESDPRLVRDLERWRTNVREMNASDAPWHLVTTFNEWGEGTAIESSFEWESPSGFGAYIDVLHREEGR